METGNTEKLILWQDTENLAKELKAHRSVRSFSCSDRYCGVWG